MLLLRRASFFARYAARHRAHRKTPGTAFGLRAGVGAVASVGIDVATDAANGTLSTDRIGNHAASAVVGGAMGTISLAGEAATAAGPTSVAKWSQMAQKFDWATPTNWLSKNLTRDAMNHLDEPAFWGKETAGEWLQREAQRVATGQ